MSNNKALNLNDTINLVSGVVNQTLPVAITETLRLLGVNVAGNANAGQVHARQPQVAPAPLSVSAPMIQTTRKAAQGSRVTSADNNARVSNTSDVPNYGDFHCSVGENRTKLPMGLFEGYSYVIFNLPSGETHQSNASREGRATLVRSLTDSIGAYASQGHKLVFTRDVEYGNMYDVSVYTPKAQRRAEFAQAAERSIAPAPRNPKAIRQNWGMCENCGSAVAPIDNECFNCKMPVGSLTDDLDSLFTVAPSAPARKGNSQGSQKAKRPATEAQLAARAKFAARSKAGTLRGGQGQPAQSQTTTRAESRAERVTPQYVRPAMQTPRVPSRNTASVQASVPFNVPARRR